MKTVYSVAKYLQYIAAAGLVVLMMLQVVNMAGRVFLGRPVEGTTDLGSYMLLVVVSLALGWAALEGRHIKVGLVMDLLPRRLQWFIDAVILLIILGVVIYVAYLNILAGLTWPPRSTSVLSIPYNPFRLILGGGFGVLSICTIVVIIEHFKNRNRRHHES